MADQPKGKAALPASRTADRTGAVVGAGMVLLAMIGVGTVFSEPISAALAPVPSASTQAAPPSSVSPSRGSQPSSLPSSPPGPAGAPQPTGEPRRASDGGAL